MNVAVFHHLPTGGALRVLGEWLRRTGARATVYTPDPSVHSFAAFPDTVRVIETPVPGPFEGLGAAKALLRSTRAARRVAATIDAAGHDVVFVLPSRLTQTPGVLRFLRTPSVYYAPEALRLAYEDPSLVFLGDGWKVRLTRAGGNPIEHLRKHLDRRAVRAARRIITHSEFTQRDLAENYGVASTVIRLGVDAAEFDPAGIRRPRIDTPRPFVLSVGALHPLKGHEFVIDAVATLSAPRPTVVVVGDRGSNAADLENRARSAGVELRVFAGLPFPELVGLFQDAAAVACAQIREPFGLVPLEAMAAATPVVAVEDGGLRESVLDGVTGFLVPRDPASMGEALARILGDEELRHRLGEAGKTTVQESWRWEQYAAGVDAILSDEARTERPGATGL